MNAGKLSREAPHWHPRFAGVCEAHGQPVMRCLAGCGYRHLDGTDGAQGQHCALSREHPEKKQEDR